MLLLFWGCLFLGLNCLSLDLSLVELFCNFSILNNRCNSYSSSASVYITFFFFFFAILLKGAILPVQAWLVLFYKHLPLTGLFAYLTFYYIYFLFVIFNLLFGYLYIFLPIWLCAAIVLFSISIVFAVFSISEAFTFRNFIAYSSIINLFFLFIFLLTSFDGGSNLTGIFN
jgi:formate hydrogenlyase subunit 3/multisubunit Na+/H+ antiporter MnhD subunit